MSYILDALKKSDQERKMGDVPGLQTVHIPLNIEQKAPYRLYIFIVFLLLVLAFMAGLLLSSNVTVVDSNEVLQLDDEENLRSEMSRRLSAGDVTEMAIKEKPAISSDIASARPYKRESVAVPIVEEAVKPGLKPARIRSEATSPGSLDIHSLPYLHELPDYRQQSIPELEFAGHVYSSSALNRSVIINGTQLSEGDSIVKGLVLIAITANGVVFESQGEQFRVDILQDWSFDEI